MKQSRDCSYIQWRVLLQSPRSASSIWKIMSEEIELHSKRVIVVDNDIETTALIAELLKSEGFAPLCYPNWLLSVAAIEHAQASLLILELGLGDPSAVLDLLTELRQNSYTRKLPVL